MLSASVLIMDAYSINQVDYNQQQQESHLSLTDHASAGALGARDLERPWSWIIGRDKIDITYSRSEIVTYVRYVEYF